MSWLLWREYRLNRLILAAGALGLLVPHVIALLVVGITSMIGEPPRDAFEIASVYSIGLSVLTVALIGGNAIAGERADRSVEFVAYLPLPRWHTLASKWLLFLITFSVVIGFNTLLAVTLLGPSEFAGRFRPYQAFYVLSCFLAIYGYCWFFSSLFSSPVLACTMGVTTYAFVFGSALSPMYGRLNESGEYVPDLAKSFEHQIFTWHAVVVVPAAIICFCIGTWLYLRRREP